MFILYDNTGKVFFESENKDELFECIYQYTNERNIEVYYVRLVEITEKITMVDYGSHSHFFYIKEIVK